MISNIYNTPYILHKSGSRKGKSKKELEREDAKIIAYQKRKLKHFRLIYKMLDEPKHLNNWELEFLSSIAKNRTLSHKQREVLKKIKQKYNDTKRTN